MGVCAVAVVAQLAGLLLWSAHVASRENLTWDFGINYQAWYLIAHGNLWPHSSLKGGIAYARDDGELLVWLLAPLWWLFPDHPLGLLWLQDLAIAGVSATCLRLVVEGIPWQPGDPARRQAAAALSRVLVTVLVVANPFVYSTATFDVHLEVFASCFALLALRAAVRGRRSALVWGVLVGLCGGPSLVYLIAVGLTAATILSWRARATIRRSSASARSALWPLGMSVAAVVWLVALGALHATVGADGSGYAYLTGAAAGASPGPAQVLLGVLEHPATAARVVSSHGWNLWANTSPSGLVGLLTPAFFLAALPMLPNNLLDTQTFSQPGFQNFVVYGPLAVGSVAVVAALLRRRRAWALGVVLAIAMAANAIGWLHAWFPSVRNFVRVSPAAAAVVAQVTREAGPGDQVVASQGFVGPLSGRAEVQALTKPIVVPVGRRTVWFVLSSSAGIQTAPRAETLEAINTVAHLPGVQALHVDDAGVWVYRWHPRGGTRRIALGWPGAPFPVWMFPDPGVVAETAGPPARWSLSSHGRAAYLVAGDQFEVEPGLYVATVRLRCNRQLLAEVWADALAQPMLGWTRATPSRVTNLRIFFAVPGSDAPTPGAVVGSGLFRFHAAGARRLVVVEVRVFVPGGSTARAWWSAVSPQAPAS